MRKIIVSNTTPARLPSFVSHESPNVLIMSGCYWHAEGGAQRPVALARVLAKMDLNVVYYNTDERQVTGYVDGVYCIGPKHWPECMKKLLEHRGMVVATLPTFAKDFFNFKRAGWRVAYDMLDDWDGFYDAGDLNWMQDQFKLWEHSMIAVSDFVTCSAQSLMKRAKKMGSLDPVLIRNGGPDQAFNRPDFLPEGMADGHIRVVYSGCLAGSWLDWELLLQLDKCEDMAVTVIGNADPHIIKQSLNEFKRVHFLGEMPYEKAMRYVACAHVGIIPFRGELCEGVDPIKVHDYRAAKIWTVATPELTELKNSPYVILARENWIKAVRQASKKRSKPTQKAIQDASWTARGQVLNSLIRKALVASSHPANPLPTHPVVRGYDEWKLRVTWSGPSTCNADPVCAYCCTRHDRAMRPGKLPVASDEMRDALLKFTEENGPCLISVCWGEPMVDDELAEIIGALGERNRVDLITNLKFPLERLRYLRNQPNYALCTSYHPQLWDWKTNEFIQKRRDVEASGIHCGVAEVVAYPQWFDRLPQWFDELHTAGIDASILPYLGTCPETKQIYPSSYSPEQWEFLKSNVIVYHQDLRDSIYDGSKSPTGLKCRAGKDYVFIDWSGEIKRCVIPQHGDAPDSLGSIFSSYKLLTQAKPCGGTACPCADLWQFIEAK